MIIARSSSFDFPKHDVAFVVEWVFDDGTCHVFHHFSKHEVAFVDDV